MDRIGVNLFDYLRSYLSFRELHRKRRVNSSWNNVEDVPKHFEELQDPPARACFKNVTKLVLHSNQLSASTIDHILSQSRATLLRLEIIKVNDLIDFIPPLKNLQILCFRETDAISTSLLLRNCPNIQHLGYWTTNQRSPFEIDLQYHSRLLSIYFISKDGILGDHITIKGLPAHTGKFTLFGTFLDAVNVDHMCRLLAQNAKLIVTFVEDSPSLKTVIIVQSDSITVSCEDSNLLKRVLTQVKKVRDVPICIAKMNVKRTYAVAKALADTELFSHEELKNMF